MDKQKLLKKAKDHCFFIVNKDSGSELCRANMVYGLASIHFIQKELGLEQNAFFISTPDMTITRNINRWKSGFGYGGKISWGEGKHKLIILNTKPNGCGMLVGGLDKLPDTDNLIKRMYEIENTPVKINGINVNFDFYKSNHFIDIFVVKPILKTVTPLPPFAFIIHGSVEEYNGDNHLGFGLYYDKSEQLKAISEKIDTPFGTFHILTGDRADEYYKRFLVAEEFSKKKRKLGADLLFDKHVAISNETHQGLINLNELLLGCHHIKDPDTLFPLTLKGDLPAYLVRGIPSLKPEIIESLGFKKRAKKLGLYKRLLNTNIFPHGGGYVLPDILTVNKVIEVGDKRYFEADMLNDRGKKIISDVRNLPYEYRGRNVVLRSLEVGLIEVVAKLIPVCVLKI